MNRITLFAGHYGSGKTNIAVNYALHLKQLFSDVILADLDIVNPYFRAKDSQKELTEAGVRFLCSEYANTNLDIPAIPAEMYDIVKDRSAMAVLDIGGDDRGAFALGRYTPEILSENDYEMSFVVNFARPLTASIEDAVSILREIEAASHIPFTNITNNTNIGPQTTAQTVLEYLPMAEAFSEAVHLPIVRHTVEESLFESLSQKIQNLFPLKLQIKLF